MLSLTNHRYAISFSFYFHDPAPTLIYTLSLHDALPIWAEVRRRVQAAARRSGRGPDGVRIVVVRSEEHTSELQSRPHLVCRLLLEKKKTKYHKIDLHPAVPIAKLRTYQN